MLPSAHFVVYRRGRVLHRWIGIALVLVASSSTLAGDPLHHDLRVVLDPAEHRIEVRDRITLTDRLLEEAQGSPVFVLHAALEVTASSDGFRLEAVEREPDRTRFGINQEAPDAAVAPLRGYRLVPQAGTDSLPREVEILYAGTIHHPLVEESAEYARSFSRTPGTIEARGAVLSGSAAWLPAFGQALVGFRLEVDLPESWNVVSQGRRLHNEVADGRRTVVWDSPEPMDDVYLVAGPFVEYSRTAGDFTAYAFLRASEDGLAAKYLDATVSYVQMYADLIGPYPYSKFALVENFWDTGYGMPSFTLLGPRIIRFPFILQSSYPHEILHNWWGNSVFVDYESGNWCEGLTAYLADHLFKERVGRGTEYRRDTLNKYGSFVRGEADFPLAGFRARHSSATEAVGYGKSMMLWHMLRRRMGDGRFAAALARFYEAHRFSRASFADLERAFSTEAGEDLRPFFEQWVERTGAPQLELGEVAWAPGPQGAGVLSLSLSQTQPGEPFLLSVPVVVTLRGEDRALRFELPLERSSTWDVPLPADPLRVDVDPEFDLFRHLDPLETPASLARLFGAERVAIVVPRGAAPARAAAWEEFARAWSRGADGEVRIIGDDAIDRWPPERAVWILGSANRWAGKVRDELPGLGAGVGEESWRAPGASLPLEDHCFAFAVRPGDDPDVALGWVGADGLSALPGLARKLPHYGRYSFVAFSGAEPTNVAKGQWAVSDSPLVHLLVEEPVARGALPDREPLAEPPPVVDARRLDEHVRRLADPTMEGRGVGTGGLERAVEYVAAAFEAASLVPGGDDGTWFQTWTEPDGPRGEPVTLSNVVGVLPAGGTGPRRPTVVVGAHVDHLGRGWPDVHAGDEGKIHPGAEDNASGVAVMLELARLLARDWVPSRDVVFVAFTAEEWGLRGSRHFVEAAQRRPGLEIMAMVNLDSVGRLQGRKIMVLGTGSATEWPHIVRGVGFTTGIEAEPVRDDPGGSDQRSFLDAGIPAVQIFAGAHEDYHRPSDRPEKLDLDGMVRVATFAREAIVYLGERDRPLTSNPDERPVVAEPTAAEPEQRRARLGTVPAFGFPGPGVKIESVGAQTPAEAAGLRPGDVIVSIDGEAIADLRAYADLLRRRAPGDTVRIRFLRDGDEGEAEATLVER